MDDFRVGPIPSADPYGHRQPAGGIFRKRPKHSDDDASQQEQETADNFDVKPHDDNAAGGDAIEDYYLPSDPNSES